MITHGAQCVCHHQITCKAVHPTTSLFCRATVAFIKGERLNQAGEAVGAVPTWNFHSLFMVIKIWGLEIGSMRSSFNLSHNSLLYFQSLTVFQINIHPGGRDYSVEKKKYNNPRIFSSPPTNSSWKYSCKILCPLEQYAYD